jgi:hypothetical protein
MYCLSCGTKLPETAKFCFNCGEAVAHANSVTQKKPQVVKTAKKPPQQIVYRHVIHSKQAPRQLSDDEKKVILKYRKNKGFRVYDKSTNLIYCFEFVDSKNPSTGSRIAINVIDPCTPSSIVRKYTWPQILNQRTGSSYSQFEMPSDFHEGFYVAENADAFMITNGYVFCSVYEGEIKWWAADSREHLDLPGIHGCNLVHPGTPQLEFLENGNIKCVHFHHHKGEFAIRKGVIEPV